MKPTAWTSSFASKALRCASSLKEKINRLADEVAAMWPEVPAAELLVLDETCYRSLMWADQMGLQNSVINRSLVYVGMTRATHELALAASGKHPYLADLDRS